MKRGSQFSCDLTPVLCEHDWWRGAQVKVEKEKEMQAEREALELLESWFQCFGVLCFLLMHPAAPRTNYRSGPTYLPTPALQENTHPLRGIYSYRRLGSCKSPQCQEGTHIVFGN